MWSIQEKDLDKAFLGQWEITRVDDYLTHKAGTSTRTAVVRSKVDIENGVIHLYSHLPQRYGLDAIVVDGTYGLCGRITERLKTGGTKLDVVLLYVRVILPEDAYERAEKIGDSQYILKGEAEMDDVVFNAQGEYTFPFTYYLKGKKQPELWGFSLDIPLDKYNHYVRMRDTWYRDYEGSSVILADET